MTSVLPDPRSLVRVLMRDDRVTGRQGLDGPRAVLGIVREYGLSIHDGLLLTDYAYGFACGLAGEPLVVDAQCAHVRAAATEGYADGLRTDPSMVLPAETTE